MVNDSNWSFFVMLSLSKHKPNTLPGRPFDQASARGEIYRKVLLKLLRFINVFVPLYFFR